MKNTVILSFTLAAACALAACSPMDKDAHSLGKQPEASQLSFTQTPGSDSPNIITLKNTSSLAGVVLWDLGNGSTAKGEEARASYPFAGDYTVTMSLFNTGGGTSISQVVHIANDDFGLLDTPNYRALTGGPESAGKTWVYDRYAAGHFGVGNVNAAPEENGPGWWQCPANGKDGCSLYDNEFTFIQKGLQLKWENKGYIYTNAGGMALLGVEGTATPVEDFDVPYTPADGLTFTLDEDEMTLTLSGGAFLGHYAGVSVYNIIRLTEHELYVWSRSEPEPGNAWYYRFIPKDELTEPEPEPEPEASYEPVSLSEDFEGELSFTFEAQDMGPLTGVYSNPSPFPINESAKVYAYQKTSAFYSNLSYVAAGKKFDLHDNNKVRLKVYVPSRNDYTTEAEVAGDWITVKTLQPQIAVKLQNSGLGGNAWESQEELILPVEEFDTWIELTFDFSPAAEREDLDKIVVQFGGEGHAAPGLFFFDDFTFGK